MTVPNKPTVGETVWGEKLNTALDWLDTKIDGIALTPGPTGPAGVDGVNGVDGINGVDGATGPSGLAGPTGPQGEPGTPAEVVVETTYAVGGGTLGATQPSFDGSPLFAASYVKTGPLVYFRINVDFTNILDFGTGQYYMTLPFASKYEVFIRSGHLHHIATGKVYSISAQVEAGTTVMNLFSTAANGTEVEFTSSVPANLTTTDHFEISGTFIKAD